MATTRSESYALTAAGLCLETRGDPRRLVALKASIPFMVGQSVMLAAHTRHGLTDTEERRPQRRYIRPLRAGTEGMLWAVWQLPDAPA